MTLAELRSALGLTQVDLDRLAGLPDNTVNQIENGKNKNPGIRACVAIVDALRRSGATGADVESVFAEQATTKP